LQVKITDVQVENIVKGRSRYSKATVRYTYNGEPRTQSIMSFSNPQVFKDVQDFIGYDVEVETGKNDAGFTEWRSIRRSGGADSTAKTPAAGAMGTNNTRVTGSNYETKEERAARQVLIVKQSSLTAAVGTLAPGAKAALDPDAVMGLAQRYADWVFDTQGDQDEVSEDIPF
jgi:hypothetical protein